MKQGLTFDDVLLVPQESHCDPTQVDTSIFLSPKIKLKVPILSAAMDTVTGSTMAIELARAGGMGIIHKNYPIEKQVRKVEKVKANGCLCGAAVSVGPQAVERAKLLVEAGADALVVDVAHGHYYKVSEMILTMKNLFHDKITLIAGNVATGKGAQALIEAGADVVKVGVGPGSICTTRIIAGIGVPQLTAVMDAVQVAKSKNIPVIADGGIKYSGDVVKALAAGASAVMLGSLFAGTDEAPGIKVEFGGQAYKFYRGMGSLGAMSEGSKDRYMQEDKTSEKEMIAEGVEGLVPWKGPLREVVYQLIGGLKQGLGYCGAKNIKELSEKAEFIQISGAGYKESHPHSLYKIKTAPNYKEPFL